MIHDYSPKVFTRESPCTKIDIWNCFTNVKGEWIARVVIEARMVIGLNTPKYLLNRGFMLMRGNATDIYELTPAGKSWLLDGTLRFLTMHPEEAYKLTSFPAGFTWNAKVHHAPPLRHTKSYPATPEEHAGNLIIRRARKPG